MTYERPLTFLAGVALTTVGVLIQLPMLYMARHDHYRLAAMPMTTTMLSQMLGGMALMLAGIGLSAYGLFPVTPPVQRGVDPISIAPLDDAPVRPTHIALLLVMSTAVAIDGMKPAAFAFLAPGAAAEYHLRGPLDPAAHALPIALYPLSGMVGLVLGSFIWGWLGDRIGRRSSILLAVIIFIATSCCGAMPRYWMNLVTCVIMGVGAGGMLPVAFALLCETVPRRHRGWMMLVVG
ncbi:MAG TPA: MFS transporter, partial [Woeseiaceae bacterium]|nr:MFS transporter [Woeseiaceae bacterium]